MKKNKEIVKLLIELYNMEMKSHNIYLSYSSILDSIGVKSVSGFLKELSNDKIISHMPKTYEYLATFGEVIEINKNSIKEISLNIIDEKETNKNKSLILLEEALKNELITRDFISNIVKLSLKIDDYETFEFLQWFVRDYIKDIKEIENLILILKDENTSVFDIKIK